MSEERNADRRGGQRSSEGKRSGVAETSRVGFTVIGGSTRAFREAAKADFPSFLSSLESARSWVARIKFAPKFFCLKVQPRHTSVPNIME